MLPLLRFAGAGKEHGLKEAIHFLGAEFRLTADELNQFLPSGLQPVLANRVGWARTYLKKAGLLGSPRRGFFRITERGAAALKEKPEAISSKWLERFPEFMTFRNSRREAGGGGQEGSDDGDDLPTPHEALEAAYARLREELAAEILAALKSSEPAQFENIVVELLVRMGYGGSRQDAGRAIGRSGDEGIDGIIKEDHLGLDNIYIQAKRWAATVGRPEIQKFAGALEGQRARKGIVISTSDFSRDAQEYVSKINAKIVLIDGATLSRLMIDFGVGVTNVASYEVKKIDLDYFSEGGAL